MDASTVRPFINAAIYTFQEIIPEIEIKRGSPCMKNNLPDFSGIATCLDYFGDLEGSVYYVMDITTALKISGRMNEIKTDNIDELARSALLELGNIVTGQAAIRFSALDKTIDITPPTLHAGAFSKNIQHGCNRFLKIPLHTSYGDIGIHVTLPK